MPENSAIHRDQDQTASFSIVYNRRDATPVTEDEDDVVESDEIQDIGELLGFRITGGRDFFMPITIFHVNITNTCCRHRLTYLSCLQVKENSRAEKANLKLGDAVICANGRDISKMTLREANRFLSKVAGGDVTLQVAK